MIARRPHRLLLVYPPIMQAQKYGVFSFAGAVAPPLGVVYLATWLARHGVDVRVVDGTARRLRPADIAKEIRHFCPDVIGFSAETVAIHAAMATAALAKHVAPRTPVVLGGVHGTVLPEDTLRSAPAIDVVVRGDGEPVIGELIERLVAGDALDGLPGIAYRRPDGEVVVQGEPGRVDDLDSLPQPDYGLLGDDFPRIYYPAFQSDRLPRPTITTLASRGCTYRCSFCCKTRSNRRYRAHTPERTIALLERLHRHHGVRSFEFQDQLFYVKRAELVRFCELLLAADWRASWACNLRADRVHADLLPLMRRAGCRQVAFGIESGSPTILKNLAKGERREQIAAAVHAVHEAGIGTTGYLMVGSPGETLETLQESRRFVQKLPLDYILVWSFQPTPGSAAHTDAPRWGTYTADFARSNCMDTLFVPHGLTEQQIARARWRFLWDFYARPGRLLREAVARGHHQRLLAALR